MPTRFRSPWSGSLLTALLLLAVLLSACAGSESAPGEAADRFRDPFAYCAAVGTIDAPDHRYVGPPVPVPIARGLQRAFGISPEQPLQPFLANTHWRCMDGEVYACNVGANIPCMERADTRRKPAPALVEFCRTNRDADVIPAVVTGRATLYEWRCREGQPQVVRQVLRPDSQGFIANFWYRIDPAAGS